MSDAHPRCDECGEYAAVCDCGVPPEDVALNTKNPEPKSDYVVLLSGTRCNGKEYALKIPNDSWEPLLHLLRSFLADNMIPFEWEER